uniref:Very-long-chain (3R)-3-hydroxyacyl-CoA dehydratase n=1 Tax=Leersia perrieri TaxID=77586 RepID=A0A0D9WHC6_9ORYZ
MARPSQLYLLFYNSVQALGWFVVLLRLLPRLVPPFSVHSSFAVAGDLVCLLQASAILETVHAAVGLVRTAPLLAFLQWGGRTHFVLAVVRQIPEVQSSPSVFITFMAWSISEVIRYSHYALTISKVCPLWLTYLRYTAFIPLYPIGVGPGEMWTMYQALPFVKERDLYSGFFGMFSMSYHSFLVAVLAIYPFLWMKLYLHVFKQRKSKLGKVHAKKRA